jgi:uncharacterized membrane protein YfcA
VEIFGGTGGLAVLILGAYIVGAFVQSVAGFGAGMIVMPLLSLAMPVAQATPTQVILGSIIAWSILLRNRAAWHWQDAIYIIAGALLGVLPGLYLLRYGDVQLLVHCLGIMLIIYALFALFVEPRLQQKNPPMQEQDHWYQRLGALCAGALGTTMGVVYATPGPPVIIYAALRRMPKARFRSLIQMFFVVNNILVMGSLAWAGFYTLEVGKNILIGLPAVVFGLFLGFKLDRHINEEKFRKVALYLIICLGTVLLFKN